MSESSETTAAKGKIADPAKIKEAAAAKEPVKDAKTEKKSSPNGKETTNGDAKSADSNGKKEDTNGTKKDEPPVAGTSKSPSKKDLDVVTRAMGYLAAGKRDLLIQDPASAVESLAQACQLLGEHYGQTAPECGEPYYYYGRALLELARMEAGVIDNVLDGEESEESEKDSKDGDEDEEDGEEGEAAANGDDKENEDEEMEEDAEEGKDDSIQGDEAEKGDVAATEKEDEEEPSNLQLAWEMLELAKNILVKQSDDTKIKEEKDRKTAIDARICDTFQTLGELSIENENYPQAIEDLGTCLQRRQKMLPEDSRLIAETHYQLGVAQGFNVEFDQAVVSLNSAISVLQKRIDNLKSKTESVDPSKKADAFYTREAEIKEIESLLPEIKEKITDTNDMKAETKKKLAEARLAGEEEIASKSDTSKVSTISTSLIKKRKKSDGEEGEEANGKGDSEPAKKPHIEKSPETTKSTKKEGEKTASS